MTPSPPPVFIQTDANPNCPEWAGQVFQPRTKPRVVDSVRCERDGIAIWCGITGLDSDGNPSPARACLVDDSGDGNCYLVFGEEWGLRFRREPARASWNLADSAQWGLPFLLLPADGSDIRFR